MGASAPSRPCAPNNVLECLETQPWPVPPPAERAVNAPKPLVAPAEALPVAPASARAVEQTWRAPVHRGLLVLLVRAPQVERAARRPAHPVLKPAGQEAAACGRAQNILAPPHATAPRRAALRQWYEGRKVWLVPGWYGIERK